MKAITVTPGTPNSARVMDIPKPGVGDVPGRRGVLVRVLQVGVDGTDKEINAGEYGASPPGDDYLVIGHESFGIVEEVGTSVWEVTPGDHVVAIVRRPGKSPYDAIGMPDMTTDDDYYEHGINLVHGFLTEYYVEEPENLVRVMSGLAHVGVLLEPASVVEKGITQAFDIQRRLRIWKPYRALVLGAGTLGLLATLALRLRGMNVVTYALPEPPYLNSELVEELGAHYVSASQMKLASAAVEFGPYDFVFEAAGFSPLTFEATQVLAKNGVLVLSGLTGGSRLVEIPADAITRAFVLGNRALVGTVSGNREHFDAGISDLASAQVRFPGWLQRLLTHRVDGLERYREMFDLLENAADAIKVVVDVSGEA